MKKILVIEGNQPIQENTAEILERSKYDVYTAANGLHGVEQVLTIKPDLTLYAIKRPALDDFGVLQLIRENPKLQHIPFIFLTARTGRSDI